MSKKQSKQVHPKFLAMCHKCCHGLWAKDIFPPFSRLGKLGINSSSYKGCAQDSRIDNSNMNELCPIREKVIGKRI